jgi:beta-glucosidase
VVLAEEPYAEGEGDRAELSLTEQEIRLLEDTRKHSRQVVAILVTGRPRPITEQLPLADAWISAWWFGSEGSGVADVLFGDYPFTGKTPYSWPRFNEQLPININNSTGKTGCDAPLFPFGYGLTNGEPTPEILECD